MSVPRLLFATIVLGAALSCDSDAVVGPRDFRRFEEAKAMWEARSFTDYSYEIRTFCFCPPEIVRWTRVTVRGGVVVAAEAVELDPNFPITTLSLWQPIDSVFASLQRTLENADENSYIASLHVEYDAQLGYPTLIELRARPTVADGDFEKNLRNVIPLN
jgi:hypothetical protein